MFKLTETGWHHGRCELIIEQYHAMAEKNRANGRLGGRKKNPVASDSQPIAKATINDKPITINHKPIKERATGVACPHDVSPQVWQDWLQLRKSKKASVTETVVKGARAEAGKLNWSLDQFLIEWCTRGSQGLKAEWVTEKQTANQKAAANMNLLTRGMSGPKAAPFWAKTETLEVIHEEPKRLV
jgi:hypothetical protein